MMDYDVKTINKSKEFLQAVIDGKEPETIIFYEQYDRLIWDISKKWYTAINTLSKGQYELEDIHNELWAHVFKNISKCDLDRSGLSSWIFIVVESKLGMIKRSLEANKNNILRNEINYSLNSIIPSSSNNESGTELLNFIGDEQNMDDVVVLQEFLLDFIYLLLELVDACTDKERRVYLLKIKGKSQNEIAEEACVSKSYIPKVYKRLSKKFKYLYDSLEDQCYIDKEERDALAKDLLSRRPVCEICNKYDLEPETVEICNEMLDIIGVRD